MMPHAHRPSRTRRHPVAGEPTLLLAFVALIALALSFPVPAAAQAWLAGGWSYRRPVTVTHPGGATLTAFQVKVTLPASFAFAHAKPDGSDLRVTSSDGTTLLPFHLDLWNPATLTARLWVKVPSIPPAGTTLYVYYGNPTASSLSDGDATYEFFDDFDSNVALGYYPLGPSQTIMVRDQAWETEGPHTLSMVPAPAGAPYTYYGYYGLEDCTGIGMAGSNDLVNWTKFASNPLFTGGGERWPHVIKDGSTYHMVHTVNFCNVPGIVRRTSTNGTTWSAPTSVVTAVPGRRNQNPNLWHDPNDGKFYLYWFEGDLATVWRIMARSATTMAGLAGAPSVELLSSPQTLAAPNMMYRDGTYFLITEIFDTVWKVKVYGGPTPLGPFSVLPGNPILGGDCACMFQHPVGNTVYEYYCKRNGSVWTLDLVQADLAAGRQPAAFIDTLKWEPSGGSWSAPAAMQFDGVNGAVVEGATPWYDILQASYTGTDYAFEAQGQLLEGRIFGIGVRMADPDNGYSINLYDDLDGTDNIYIYQWDDGIATEIWKAPVGPVSKNTWYKLKLKVSALGFQLWLNDSLRTPSWVGANPAIPSGPAALYLEDGTRAQFDDVRVYKYAPNDPTTSVGGESTPSNSAPVAVISAPANGAAVSPAAAVTLTSGSTDAQDPPASLAFRWDVRALRSSGDSVVIHTATTQHSAFTPPVGDDSTIVRYRVIHRVTDTQGASDSTSVTVWPEVDLQPAALAVSPAAPVGTDSLTFTFRLRNLGKALAPKTRWRLVADAGTLLAQGDRAVPALDSALVSVRVGALAVGAHTVRVKADTLGALTETDEANNAAMLGFTTAPNTPPVAAIVPTLGGPWVSPAAAVLLHSASTDAQDSTGALAHRWDVRTLRSDGDSVVIHTATTRNTSFTPPAGDDSTIVRYRVVHRVTDTQGASDSVAVLLWPEVDLHPAALAVSPAAPVGTDSLTFSFRLHNQGQAPAPRTRWRLVADAGLLLAEGDLAVPALDSALVSVRVGALASGPHTVRVAADTLAALEETDESDNAAVLAFTAAPNTAPVAAIAAPADDATVSPAAAVTLTSASTDAEDTPATLTHRWDVRTLRSDGDSVVIHTATTRHSAFTPPAGDPDVVERFRVVHRVTDRHGASDSTAITLWPEVDLEPAALGVTPAAPVGIDSLTFAFTLHNRGQALAPKTRWRLVADGVLPVAEGDVSVPALDSVRVEVRVGALGVGPHGVRVTADTLGVLRETDESDNAAMLEFTTGPNSTPTAVIAAPADGARVSSQAAVTLTSGSFDSEDPPSALAHRWDVRLHRRPIGHPPGDGPPPPARAGRAGAHAVTDGGGEDSLVVATLFTADASFTPPVGDDSTTVFFRVVHTVTDLQGLSDSTSIVLLPDVDLEPAALAVWPAEPMGVDSIAFTFTLHNRGGATAPRTLWRLVVDDSLRVFEGVVAVPGLDSVVVTVPVGPFTLGPHVVRVAADSLGDLDETDESDNAVMLTFTTGGSAGVPAGPGGTPASERVALAHPYPNPSGGQGATLGFALARPARVVLAVYDVSGRLVRRLIDEERAAGDHAVRWDGRGESGTVAPNGLYMVRLHSGADVLSRRLMVLR